MAETHVNAYVVDVEDKFAAVQKSVADLHDAFRRLEAKRAADAAPQEEVVAETPKEHVSVKESKPEEPAGPGLEDLPAGADEPKHEDKPEKPEKSEDK